MLTGTARRPTDARNFVLRGVAGSIALFGLLRLNWTAEHLVVPITSLQAGVATTMFGASALPVEVTLACSGADALALCIGAVLAYPVPWRTRLIGAVGGAGVLLGINTLRIGTLGLVSASPVWFNTLHAYVWPALLTLGCVGYVFTWMHLADQAPHRDAIAHAARPQFRTPLQPSRPFVALAALFLVLFIAAAPLYLENAGILAVAIVIAQAAAAIVRVTGADAHAVANVLWTSSGGVLVTQECIATPLVPVYLAAVCTNAQTWRRMAFGVVATLPLLVALGIARLLVLALPAFVASPFVLVHAFYQLLLGVVVVYIAAHWQHGGKSAPGYAAAGVFAGTLFVLLLGPVYTRLVIAQPLTAISDPQGAITFLPAFQVGLYLALGVAALSGGGWRSFVAGLALLAVTQTVGLLALDSVTSSLATTVHVRDVRGWAVVGPVVIFAMVVNLARARR